MSPFLIISYLDGNMQIFIWTTFLELTGEKTKSALIGQRATIILHCLFYTSCNEIFFPVHIVGKTENLM